MSFETKQIWKRFSRMSWDELRTRAGQEVSKRRDTLLYRLGTKFNEKPGLAFHGKLAHFFFTSPEVLEISNLLRQRLPEEADRIVELARRITLHRFDLLGYADLSFGDPIDWHLDAVHGKRAPLKPWYRIPYLDFDTVGDAKITWELNRHQHLVTLAKAYRLTGDDRFAAEVFRQWYDWQKGNPYPIGINWASSLEVAFRSLSWLWVWHLLSDCPVMPKPFGGELAAALRLNGQHIERYLSTYFSPNTHLLGEGVALFFLGVLCPQIPAATRWLALGWNIVLREANRQVQADGMHFEQSIYYHVYALDFFLHARILAAANQIAIPPDLDRTLLKMLNILCQLSHAGPPPRLGDDDGGRLYNPQRNRAEHMVDPLSTGAVLFQRPEFKGTSGGMREETLWLLGPQAMATFDGLPDIPQKPVSASFCASGIFVMTNEKPEPRQLVIHAGPLGANTGGHSHADALSVTLCVDGNEYLTDPGTGAYVSEGKVRNAFRTTSAHNTLRVLGAPQAEPKGPFTWGSKPEVKAETWLPGETFDLFVGSVTSQSHLQGPIVHRRWVFHLKSKFWFIRDIVLGDHVSTLDLSWHLAPGSKAQRGDSTAPTHSIFDPPGLALLTVEDHDWTSEISMEGWSPAYGRVLPAPVVRFHKEALLPAEFVTMLFPVTNGAVELGNCREIAQGGKEIQVRGYKYVGPEGNHFFFIGQSDNWELAGWSSDASFLYCQTSPDDDLRHIIFCDGRFVEIGDRRLFGAIRKIARCEWWRGNTTPQLFCSDDDALVCVAGEVIAETEPAFRGENSLSKREGER
jgi:hypothetical protein